MTPYSIHGPTSDFPIHVGPCCSPSSQTLGWARGHLESVVVAAAVACHPGMSLGGSLQVLGHDPLIHKGPLAQVPRPMVPIPPMHLPPPPLLHLPTLAPRPQPQHPHSMDQIHRSPKGTGRALSAGHRPGVPF